MKTKLDRISWKAMFLMLGILIAVRLLLEL